jgi:hypothetical protein
MEYYTLVRSGITPVAASAVARSFAGSKWKRPRKAIAEAISRAGTAIVISVPGPMLIGSFHDPVLIGKTRKRRRYAETHRSADRSRQGGTWGKPQSEPIRSASIVALQWQPGRT